MSTNNIIEQLVKMQEEIDIIIDTLGSDNQEAITQFGELEMRFESIQSAFDDLEMEIG